MIHHERMDLKISRLLDEMVTNTGDSVSQLNQQGDVLLVFLRFFGCSFCREAIADLGNIKTALDAKNIKLVFVHMSRDEETPDTFFDRYQLNGVDHISDPTCYFYQGFGLVKATPGQLFGFGNFVRGFQSGVLNARGFAQPNEAMGEPYQMPGVFYFKNGTIAKSFIHKMPYDRPDYMGMVNV
jgi:AhpC/TSA family